MELQNKFHHSYYYTRLYHKESFYMSQLLFHSYELPRHDFILALAQRLAVPDAIDYSRGDQLMAWPFLTHYEW